jgi:two-component system response regulator
LKIQSESKVILLIEDNIDDERLTLRALRKSNVMNEVVVAGDGQDAVDYLFGAGSHSGRNRDEMPSFIILDLKLPKLSGLEVLKRIRSSPETQHIPVVVLTASDEPSKIRECYENGANTYVRKPTDPEEFSEAILQVAMYWLLLNEVAPARATV